MEKTEKKIGIIAARLGGLDGVSLEVDKWVKVLKKMGWKVYFCAGEILGGSPRGYNQIPGRYYSELINATIIPELSVNGELNKKIKKHEIEKIARSIETNLLKWLEKYKIKKIIIENINSLPVHIPAAVAIDNILEKKPDINALFHHHDFYWERTSSRKTSKDTLFYLKRYFPPKRKNARHITINSSAQKALFKKHGIKSVIIPNIFESIVLKKDEYNRTFKKDIGLEKDDIVFLVPVRIVPRKNIETAIDLVKKLNNPRIKLVIAGCVDLVDSNSQLYFKKLKTLSLPIKNRVKFICSHIGHRRKSTKGKKIYTLFDIYAYADFVLYPTLYEGWGNALGEAMALQIPALVNRYKIFKEDIEKIGFRVVKINNGKINSNTPEQVMEILNNKTLRKKIVETNRSLVKKHLGLRVLGKILTKLLS
jgi:glycosyltransferase involved in cell wall biosynthesis